ncbi:Putrescine transport system permease protein PotH [Lacunisphaera limnophila]|uniref:Putrescine transport system permease protein PotH n=1 Tax=Lacunisphaera limnophila TaxID=1838286 RepID=A0A1D8AYC0_9BACT|nr:iron ABC transporter permease [Lacunisphaera limnophila]AOS45861.1 Putrescine transport system permease protein PotH [Lacunisphaera limnophila]
MSQNFARSVFAITLVFFAAFFFWPILQILKGGFIDADGHLTFAYLASLLTDPIYLGGLANSFLLALTTTFLALCIALPLAFVSDRFLFPLKGFLGSFILVPMILPPFVGAIGIKQILGQYGALNAVIIKLGLRPEGWTFDWLGANQFLGIAIVTAFSLYPIIYLNAVAALANIDPAMEEAAENLGCTGFRKFFKITLPLIKSGLFAGGTIVFIWSFTDLGVPLIFDYARVTSVQIFYGLKDIGGNPFPYALVAVMLFSSVAFYAIGKGLFGRDSYAMMAKATSSGGPQSLPPARAWFCTALFAGVTFIAILPHLGVVLVAFSNDWYASVLPRNLNVENFRLALGHDLTVSAIANSLKYASISTVIDLIIGVLLAYVIVRSKVRGRQILDFLAMLPLAVPGLVLAFGYLAMSQEGKFFSFINPVADPTILLIIAYSIRRLPYVVRSAAAGFQQTSETLEEAAQNLGCPPLKSVFKVTLPLIMANLIAGGLLAFSFAMLEVSDSLILAQKQAFYPITKAIYELFQLLGDGKFIASALGVWAMAFLGITIAGMTILLGKKLGAIFRV